MRDKMPTDKFVLQKFTKDDEKKLKPAVKDTLEAIELLIKDEEINKI